MKTKLLHVLNRFIFKFLLQGVISVSWKVKGGTVRPFNPFRPAEDAEALHKAMKGFGGCKDTMLLFLKAV